MKKRYHNDGHTLETIEKKIIKKLPLTIPESDSIYAKYYFYYTWGSFYYIKQDLENTKLSFEKLLEEWDNLPSVKTHDLRQYIIIVANLINIYIISKEYKLVPNGLKKLEKIKPETFYESAFKFQNYYFFKLLYLLNLHKYKEATLLVPEIEKGLPIYFNNFQQPRLISFYYNITIAYFLTQNYEKADEWLEKILSITRTDESRKDIQHFARILQLAIYYQLGHHERLEYMIRSVYRNKLVKEDMQPFDKLILKYFKKLQKVVPHSSGAFKIFETLKTKLNELEEDQHLVTGYEDFSLWLGIILEKQKK